MVKLVALVALATAACLPKTYTCAQDSDCGANGMCQANHFCSFADTACSSGYRYGDLSGSYTGQCVGTETGIDARTDSPAIPDGATDGSPDAAAPFCDPTGEPSLVGCWEFENNVNDASGQSNNGTPTAVTYAAGKTGQAAVLTASSHIAVPDSASLATATNKITIEGWINPSSLPTGTARMGILDNDSRYGFFVYATTLGCTVSTSVSATVTLTTNTWTHVACTYDGSTGTGIIYVNGTQVGTPGTGGGALGAGNGNGVALGGNSPSADTLVGMIDQYRVYNVARTAQQICRDAGQTTCP